MNESAIFSKPNGSQGWHTIKKNATLNIGILVVSIIFTICVAVFPSIRHFLINFLEFKLGTFPLGFLVGAGFIAVWSFGLIEVIFEIQSLIKYLRFINNDVTSQEEITGTLARKTKNWNKKTFSQYQFWLDTSQHSIFAGDWKMFNTVKIGQKIQIIYSPRLKLIKFWKIIN